MASSQKRGTLAQANAPAPEPKAANASGPRVYFFAVDPNHPETGRDTTLRLESDDEQAVADNGGSLYLRIDNYAYETESRAIADQLTRRIKAGKIKGIAPKIVVIQTCPLCKTFKYETSAKGTKLFQEHLLAEHTDTDAAESNEEPDAPVEE